MAMQHANAFLGNLAVVLCVAAATTVLFHRLRQPVVLGYILAGLIVGPYVPVPLVADRAIVQELSELGVILLLFSIGLEFTFGKLLRVGGLAAVIAVAQVSVMLLLGDLAGRALGWTPREALYAGAIVAISSTTIIAKAFDESGITGRLRELVLSVLVIEDLLRPVRALFAAVFFVSVGMLIDPALIARHWAAVLLLTSVVVVGKVVGVSVPALLSGAGVRTSVQAGMSMAQIGEFSFIIAGLGLSLGATRDFLYPVAVAVSAVTTLTTPFLIRWSGPAAAWVDAKLPRALQTFVALEGAWIEELRPPRQRTQLRRLGGLLPRDAA